MFSLCSPRNKCRNPLVYELVETCDDGRYPSFSSDEGDRDAILDLGADSIRHARHRTCVGTQIDEDDDEENQKSEQQKQQQPPAAAAAAAASSTEPRRPPTPATSPSRRGGCAGDSIRIDISPSRGCFQALPAEDADDEAEEHESTSPWDCESRMEMSESAKRREEDRRCGDTIDENHGLSRSLILHPYDSLPTRHAPISTLVRHAAIVHPQRASWWKCRRLYRSDMTERRSEQQEVASAISRERFVKAAVPVLVMISVAAAYMLSSVGLIAYNRFLMKGDHFPHAVCLAMAQMMCSSALGVILFRLCPSWYPSQTDPDQKVDIDVALVARVVPIGVCFAIQLVLSNMAFLWSSIAFLQMMKEANVVFIYGFCCALGLEEATRQRFMLVLFITGATALTVHGEMHLSWQGLSLQLLSMIFESFKNAYTKWNLSSRKKVDALTLNMLVAPTVLVTLFIILGLAQVWDERPTSLSLPSLQVFYEARWLLLGNGCLAFVMNALQYMFVQRTSLIIMILSSILVKDTMVVVYSAVMLGEMVQPMQIAGFLVQVVGAGLWAMVPTQAKAPEPAPADHRIVPVGRSISTPTCLLLPALSRSTSIAGVTLADGAWSFKETDVNTLAAAPKASSFPTLDKQMTSPGISIHSRSTDALSDSAGSDSDTLSEFALSPL